MKMFLASVGNAQLLGKKNGVLKHIADVRTLTESTLGFTSSMEEVRAGEGAKLYGRFNHTAGMTVTLTDAMFDLEYIAQQIGSAADKGDATAFYNDESFTIENKVLTPGKDVANIGTACGLDHAPIWIKEKGCDAKIDWQAIMPINADAEHKTYNLEGTSFENKSAANLCVRYFVAKPEARQVIVNANFIPAELILILTTKLFAGDANAPESGKPVGYITVKVPRFQLDGQFDLNMAMAAAATMSLNGTALAVEDGSCDGAGVYAEIVEVLTDSTFTTGLIDIKADELYLHPGDAPVVYGLYQDGHLSVIPNSDLTFTEGTLTNAGKWRALNEGEPSYTATIQAKDGDAVKGSETVTIPTSAAL